jgi:hypothetical protein
MGKLTGDDEDQDQTGDQPQHVDDPNDDTDGTAVQAEDASVPQVIEDDGEPDGDARIAASEEEDDQDDEPQHRRRESAKERRERAKQARNRDKQSIDILTQTTAKQNEALENLKKQLIVMQITDLDTRLATESQTAQQMDEVFAAAITQKNGKDAAAAAQLRDDAKQKAWNLFHQKEALVKQLNAPRQADVPFKDKAMAFISDKPWYNPASGDEDSLIVEAMDKALSKRMNPNDPKYWETLDKKVRERLPHKFADADDQDDEGAEDDPAPRQRQQAAAPRRKGPPTGGSSRTNSGGRPTEIRLPPEMVQTMKDAGYWDDPKVRARVAQRYIDGVKQNKRNG